MFKRSDPNSKQMKSSLKSYPSLWLCISLTMASLCSAAEMTITVENKCSFTVWPALSSYDRIRYPEPTGFQPVLNAGDSFSTRFVQGWTGIIWGRFGCSFNSAGRGSCLSGDCEGHLRCEELGVNPKLSTPNTQVEVGDGSAGVSIDRGFNLPMSIKSCGHQECTPFVADVCPKDLQVKKNNQVVGCQGKCTSYLRSCSPEEFDKAFRKACPNTTFLNNDVGCSLDTDYTVTFCPSK